MTLTLHTAELHSTHRILDYFGFHSKEGEYLLYGTKTFNVLLILLLEDNIDLFFTLTLYKKVTRSVTLIPSEIILIPGCNEMTVHKG